jgi:Zn-dependent alcohol dehydrogenase|tara:strand:+ start:1073 stop:2191 length:1119 start_codon:yes stop_codon:yes gene_type:complete
MRVESHSIAKEKTLKAAVCRTFGLPLIVEDITIADPGEGEVKVKLAACAICHSDIMLADGHWGGELPAIYGHEASGIVESLGPGVHDLAVGDRVVVTLIRSCGHCHYCAHAIETQCEATFPLDEHSPLSDHEGAVVAQGLNAGAFAESVVVEQSQICRIPDDIPLEVASILGCGVLTGFGAVTNTVEVSPGSIVAVMGCGGVGINSIQAAAYRGASRVIAVDVLDEKLEQALRFGATHTVNSSLPTFVDDVLGLSGGRGADYVFVTVGAKSAIKQSLEILGRAGTTVIVGMPASEVLAEYDPGDLASKGQSIVGSKMGSSSVSRDIPKLVALYQQGDLKLDELVSQRFSLENINEAIASVKRGEALRNLVVF